MLLSLQGAEESPGGLVKVQILNGGSGVGLRSHISSKTPRSDAEAAGPGTTPGVVTV